MTKPAIYTPEQAEITRRWLRVYTAYGSTYSDTFRDLTAALATWDARPELEDQRSIFTNIIEGDDLNVRIAQADARIKDLQDRTNELENKVQWRDIFILELIDLVIRVNPISLKNLQDKLKAL